MIDKSFNESFDVVVISTLRTELLNLTLASFKKHFLNQFGNYRIILNVDPVGEENCSQGSILKLVKRYSDDVIACTPKTGNFSQAVFWAWSQVESPYFLHLEDDWFLKKKVLKDDVFKQLELDGKLAGIRLNLSRNPSERPLSSNGLSLNPSIFRTSVIKSLLKEFDIAKDPEKQFRNNESLKMQNFVYYGKPNENSYVVDTGKKWRKSLGLAKWDITSTDVSWIQSTGKLQLFQKLFNKGKYRLFLIIWKIRLSLGF